MKINTSMDLVTTSKNSFLLLFVENEIGTSSEIDSNDLVTGEDI